MPDHTNHGRIGHNAIGNADRFFGIAAIIKSHHFDLGPFPLVEFINGHDSGSLEALTQRRNVPRERKRQGNFYTMGLAFASGETNQTENKKLNRF